MHSKKYYRGILALGMFVLLCVHVNAQKKSSSRMMQVGVASIDITPTGPILLAGYGERKSESEGVLQPLFAKALAFGTDAQHPAILITADLIGIQWFITKEVAARLSKKAGILPANVVVCATHTHSGPEIGNLINHFSRQLAPEEIGRIDSYLEVLTDKLEQVALEALKNRQPSTVSWAQGKAGFAMNRRKIVDGKAINISTAPGGPVDHDLPVMRVADANGKVKAVFVSYACHGTTLGGNVNQIHGDWMGEAARMIQEEYPGSVALVALGCGADANPEPRLKMEYTTKHGKEVADEVKRLLSGPMNQLTKVPSGKSKTIELPFYHIPTVEEFVQQTSAKGSKGYFAKLALDKIARGEKIPESLAYPVATWTFGKDLSMVFLAGEVTVDYSLRLKKELDRSRTWINAYSNDVPCYIASKRVIQEGGYEVEYSMYSYNRPSRFSEEVEDLIVGAVHELLPSGSKPVQKTALTRNK